MMLYSMEKSLDDLKYRKIEKDFFNFTLDEKKGFVEYQMKPPAKEITLVSYEGDKDQRVSLIKRFNIFKLKRKNKLS